MARTRASDFAEKQQDLLRNAAAVIAEQGMDKASMSQIAERAGVSKALLYHYYPGKDALIFAIIETHLSEVDDAVAAADDASLADRERLRRLIGAVLDVYRGADNEHVVQLNAKRALTEDQQQTLSEIERRIVRRFSVVIDRINPDLHQGRPLLMPVTMSLFGMMNWVYMWFKDGGPITREDYADIATSLILEGVKAVR
ncbi:MAG TPA: TetR/AcrR family transcriptional regulator [Paracoccus sp. (in: a-proteobacteria)]|uniref:TetR/AcrR family transcriptional regulator n=1 Tax=uncultured Paracoccus sp. TaxID=189685 RepID=UPI002632E9A1|nr:TetR/AcrR family transcriptional regulator [uncultured Paracoccus sp.]HMQ41654.1 TetR/AcrR family transcriptional regulator [Paracoccus sp. (in: a-proteobacteria)]HMR36512.1 TetR/AcrR family transcriptional regulator [Paracoccus sp. (in: a-proteobacteria)]